MDVVRFMFLIDSNVASSPDCDVIMDVELHMRHGDGSFCRHTHLIPFFSARLRLTRPDGHVHHRAGRQRESNVQEQGSLQTDVPVLDGRCHDANVDRLPNGIASKSPKRARRQGHDHHDYEGECKPLTKLKRLGRRLLSGRRQDHVVCLI